MTERPILFSGPMVKAILAGQKTMTRRVIKPQPGGHPNDEGYLDRRCPYGVPGDRLWVRETWGQGVSKPIFYRADYNKDADLGFPWKPSIHMPRWASRILLEVVSVRAELVQAISEDDAIAEGIRTFINDIVLDSNFHMNNHAKYSIIVANQRGQQRPIAATNLGSFAYLWDSINAKRGFSWDTNPWVWVVEFRRLDV